MIGLARLLPWLLVAMLLPVWAMAQDFPRSVQHALGETVIPEKPGRIVTVGYHDQDFVYALGLAPVGVHEWFGDKPYATWAWAEPARQALNATPAVQQGFEVDIEWVYAQKPDLIVATFYNLDPSTYYLLSRIAPVVAQPKGYPAWGAPWQAELRLIAQATGTEARAETIIQDLQARISGLAAANPQFQDRTATIGFFAADHFVGYGSTEGANRLLAQLGFRAPPLFDELVQANGQFSVSPERVDLFEVDALVWLVDPVTAARIQDMPVYRQTRLSREGRSIWLDPDLNGALSFMSPLSIAYALDRLEPLLQAAVE